MVPLDQCFAEENSSCKPSCSENDRHLIDDNTSPLNLVCRFYVSSAHLQNGEVDESSVSADVGTSPVHRTPLERKCDRFPARLDDFDLGCDSEKIVGMDSTERDAEEKFSKLIFSSLLELIISTKLMEMSVNDRGADSDQAAECKTPTHSPVLTGIVETCPPTPMRRTLFVKEFDRSICRKLDFNNCLD